MTLKCNICYNGKFGFINGVDNVNHKADVSSVSPTSERIAHRIANRDGLLYLLVCS